MREKSANATCGRSRRRTRTPAALAQAINGRSLDALRKAGWEGLR